MRRERKTPRASPGTGSATFAESPNLDLLRAIAVLAVYFFHLSITLGATLPPYAGRFGVLIFFVHTSLVLMMSLERIENAKRPLATTFYVRRFFRIYPLSVLCVTAIVLFRLPRAPWWPWLNPDGATILTNLLLCTNLFYKEVVTSVLWSLPYEVQMYLVLPLVYLVGRAYGSRGVLTLWCAAVLAGIVQPHVTGRLDIAQYGPCFMAGVASYFLGFGAATRRLPFIGWPVVIAIAGGILAYGSHLGFPGAGSWIMCLMLGLTAPLFADLEQPALRKGAAWIARYSYGIYLTHLYAQWAALVVLKEYPAAVRYAVLVVLSLGAPITLYHLVESPMITVGVRVARRLPIRVVQTAVAVD
jgi:peptidoglycan/LPS O-acetylase OafA/YrhL